MSQRDEWRDAVRSDRKPHFLTAEEVAALLASDDCTDAQRAWFTNIKPVVLTRRPVTSEEAAAFRLRIFGLNPLAEDSE